MTRILFYLDDYSAQPWVDALLAVDPDLDIRTNPDWGSPDDGPAYAFVWQPKPGLIASYPNIQAVFSLGAGVDHLTSDPSLPEKLPIIRMGDDGLKEGMREYVLMGVLMAQRGLRLLQEQQRDGVWKRYFAPAASEISVGLMGYGALGKTVAEALKPLGFRVISWSRTAKSPEDGVQHYTGSGQLRSFLEASQVVVGLLPDTPDTHHLLNADSLQWIPRDGFVINAGRGGLLDLDALIAHLDGGHLAGALLDVFEKEPLAANHPAWNHRKITITPHIAAITRPQSAADYVMNAIAILQNGAMPPLVLDRKRGY